MFKFIAIAAGLLVASQAMAADRAPAAGSSQAAGHVKVFDGQTAAPRAAPKPDHARPPAPDKIATPAKPTALLVPAVQKAREAAR